MSPLTRAQEDRDRVRHEADFAAYRAAFESMREALNSVIYVFTMQDTGEEGFGAAYPNTSAALLKEARAALAQADRVSKP